MGLGVQSYPTRRKPFWYYIPVTSLGCFVFICIGLGLWIHYTSAMYDQTKQGIIILNITFDSSTGRSVDVQGSLAATASLYAIFSTVIIALSTWKGYLEAEQDLTGAVYKHMEWFLYANLLMHIIWGIIMIWIVLTMMGDAVFAAWVYTVNEALRSALNAQVLIPASLRPTLPNEVNGYNCPTTCFNANTMGILVDQDTNQYLTRNCVCSRNTLENAFTLINSALNQIGGLLVGIWFMFLCGYILNHLLSVMWSQMRTWIDLNERLLGIAESGS